MFVSGSASILHADLDAFFASVEQRDDPRLQGRPVIVGGGVVLAASYEAKAYGVRTAMGGRPARRLCPHAVVVPPRIRAYSEASKAVFAVFEDTTPLVEGLSIDEAFLDVRGLERISARRSRSPRGCGARVRERGRAADHRRRRAHEVPRQGRERRRQAGRAAASCRPSGELAFLHPLPVERAVGRGQGHRGQARTRAGSRRSARSPGSPRTCSCRCSGGRRAATCTRSRTTATRARCTTGRRRRSIGSQRALGPPDRTAEELDADARRARRPRDPPAARGAAGLPHGGAAAALRRLLPRDALAHAPRADGDTRAILAAARELLAQRMPTISEQRHHADRHLAGEPRRRRTRSSSSCPSTGATTRRRRGAGRGARPLRLGGDHPRGAARPGQRHLGADAAGLIHQITAAASTMIPT